jgi:hypothetical protein
LAPALSHSFFADPGCASFVKADVHVTDVVGAALKLDGKPAPQLCIDFVRQMAEETGRTPRAIDKLMYFACSGKLYSPGWHRRRPSQLRRKRGCSRTCVSGIRRSCGPLRLPRRSAWATLPCSPLISKRSKS